MRQVQYTLTIEVDEGHKNAVLNRFPSLDELWKLPGVHRVSFATVVEHQPDDA